MEKKTEIQSESQQVISIDIMREGGESLGGEGAWERD
jgi:hypothetical protein